MHFLITSPLGLETLTKNELKKLGLLITSVEDKAIYFDGEIEDMMKANLHSRYGNKVYIILGAIKGVDDFDKLYDNMQAIDWKKYIPKDSFISVQATSIKSDLSSVPALQSVGKKAIIQKLISSGSASFDTRGDLVEDKYKGVVEIRIFIQENKLRILLNTSGNALYKRGYRIDTGEAPIKENLAAAMVFLSKWHFKAPLYDPFCGSGTVAIEAYLLARNIPPGHRRRFAFQDWKWVDDTLFQKIKEEANKRIYNGTYKISGTDYDVEMIEIAKKNLQAAGIGEDEIDFRVMDYGELFKEIGADKAYIITNPPYGERLTESDVDKIHADLAKQFEKDNIKGGIISDYPKFEDKSDAFFKKRKLYNGGVMCYFYSKD